MSTLTLTRCPIHPDDKPFLYQVYASTRLEELAPLGWSAQQQAAFLAQQFSAQHHYYQANYAGADFQIILVNEQPAGRLYVEHRAEGIHIIDIALLPEHRNAGIGSRLLAALLDEADAAGVPVSLHVEKFNPALRLYQGWASRRLRMAASTASWGGRRHRFVCYTSATARSRDKRAMHGPEPGSSV
jgi:ribosomal protein S18 acetylase RimI-like enzyme